VTEHKDPLIWKLPDLRGSWRATQLLEKARSHPDRELVVDLSKVGKVFPNGAVPFAANLAFLRSTSDQKITVLLHESDTRLERIDDALTIGNYVRGDGDTLTHSVWRYESETDAQKLANMYMEALTEQVQCEEGVIDAINWCLYEVMDNVFSHSRAGAGYVMMQLHKVARLCVIAVADTGIGIQRSLAETRAAPVETLRDASSAIEFSLQQGATSKGGAHQGNGLYGLRRAAEVNGGVLNVTSGWGRWSFRDGKVTRKTDKQRILPDIENHQSTLVDWQLDCSRKVRIDEALGTSPINDFLESIEDDEGIHRISVNDIEESLGSRKLGADIRTRLENYLKAGAQFVLLDFKNVGVVSSSFADEVIAKLAENMGELEFRRRVFVDNASVTNRALIERAISLRLAESESP